MRAPDLLDLRGRPVRVSRIDEWLRDVYADAGGRSSGMALVAVGGLGRGEAAPASDLDLLLLHESGSVGDIPDRLWYPLWDAGFRLDHSVRTPKEARALANSDLKVILGLLDARTIGGDPTIVEPLRNAVLADWRSSPHRLSDLRHLVEARRESRGDLGHLLEPDLKESYGGLRDLTVLRAIAASWVVDVPHGAGLARSRDVLLDCRDELHHESRRALDVLRREEQTRLAEILGHASAETLLREVLSAGRTIAFASDQAWHRVERTQRPRTRGVRARRSQRSPAGAERVPLADGVVVQDGEVVLSLDARPEADPVLLLRAAAAAAQAELRLSDHAIERLSRSMAMPEPWPPAARDALVSLLGAGPSLVPVWEALDQAGLISRLFPEWEAVRSLPQSSPVHRFTVDRHLVETAASAAQHTRQVSRPDLLLLGALLHDIGKGRGGDHSEVGAEITVGVVQRLGFDVQDARVMVAMVRHHLVLPETAVRRDLSDPGTIHQVAAAVGTVEVLDLLAALAVADAAATGPAAWSRWKAGLVDDLVRLTRAHLTADEPPRSPDMSMVLPPAPGATAMTPEPTSIEVGHMSGPVLRHVPDDDGWRLEVVAVDRAGLLADIAGLMSLHRLEIRSADVVTWVSASGGTEDHPHTGDEANTERHLRVNLRTRPLFGDPPGLDRLRADLRRVTDGTLDVAAALETRAAAYPRQVSGAPPRVIVDPVGSTRATILEVRAHDQPGLLHRLLRAMEAAGASVTAARMSTLGSEAVDAFYLVDVAGEPLREAAVDRVVDAVTAAAQGAAPLGG